MSHAGRAVGIYKDEGAFSLLRRTISFAYNQYLRPQIPAVEDYPQVRDVVIGTEMHRKRMFDDWVPLEVPPSDSNWNGYKTENIDLIENHVEKGDGVVVIGGGFGVTSVVAARQVGIDSSVTIYEGSSFRVETIRRTLELNDVEDRGEVRHAIVGQAVDLAGLAGEADKIPPQELPECDVLEMDCEGAELGILSELRIRPRVIIVETHPQQESSTEDIQNELTQLGYQVVEKVEESVAGHVLAAHRS